jgi:fructose-1,6-bisphosphatase/inositol monophosphatase family enzyme
VTADLDQLVSLIREAASEKILPRFRALSSDDIEEKSKGDFVTIADREAELFLAPRLVDLVPGSLVIGEEATAANPDLLRKSAGMGPTWHVDPIDGTSLFVDGNPGFATMIAFADKGDVLQSVIFFPVLDELFIAERGAGTTLVDTNGSTGLAARTSPTNLSGVKGAFYTKHYPDGWEARLSLLKSKVASSRNEMCAAREYTDIARGTKDLATYHRMLPWDHAPGSLILRETGGVTRNVETDENYRPEVLQGPHVLAANEELWLAAQLVMT